MLKLGDLAVRSDFSIGPLAVSPSRRRVAGPAGEVHLEPLIMQVFLLLLDARGRVVTRTELFDQCWGGVMVGDDSLNRAIAKVRRIAAEVAPGLFEIETIPRTGYRLTGPIVEAFDCGTSERSMSRRRVIATGIAALGVAGGGGAWLIVRRRDDARFRELLRQSETAVRNGSPDQRTVHLLGEAVAMRPDSAKASGLLALVLSNLVLNAASKDAARMIEQAEGAARTALSIDSREPNALLAMFRLQGSTLDWFTRDRRLRQIIAIDPNYVPAIAELVLMLQAAGMNRESWNWNERAIALEPLSVDFLGKRALKHWIAGRVAEADKVIDHVRALYPSNPWAWWVRFLILAMTDRVQAARAMLDSNPAMIADVVEARVWRTALTAFIDRSAAAIARARQACFDGSKVIDQIRGQSTMILSELGDVDAAFEIANGYLLSRGSLVQRHGPGPNLAMREAFGRINMQWMFTPPCAVMRTDARFTPLCDGIGLTGYWRRRGVRPDYLVQT